MAKRTGVESQYCVVPRKSIKLLGESVGIGYLSSEVASTLAEDASYRIRQSVQSASQFVKHSKRDHMTGDDVNRALFWSHVEPIYGYGSKNSNIFSSITTKDGDLFFHEDKEINLRELAFSKGFSSLSDLGSCEINVEVSMLDKPSANKGDSQGDAQTSSSKPEFESLNPVVKTYFNQVTRNVITADHQTVKVILENLKTNARIQVLLPYLIHFITTAIQTLIENIPKLVVIFDLIKALIDNKHLYLEPYIIQLVRAVMYCLIEKPVLKISTSPLDEWSLRKRSALLLCHIDRTCIKASNFLHLQLLRTFKDIYHASDRSLLCQYGAVSGMTMLDFDAIEQTIFPHLNNFTDVLVKMQDNDPTPEKMMEILHILDILKISTIAVFRNKLKNLAMIREKQEQFQKSRSGHRFSTDSTSYKSIMADSKHWNKHVPEWYKQIYDIVGDSLVLFLGNVEDCTNFTPFKPVTRFRNSILNQSKLQYIRKIIQNAIGTRGQKPLDSLGFSLQAEKTRRLQEFPMSKKVGFSDVENSQRRFQNLLENSVRAKRNLNFRSCTGKLSCLSAKRTSFRKSTIALLSLPL